MFRPAFHINSSSLSLPDVFLYLGIGILVLLASMFLGLVAVTASPLLVGLAAGLIGGAFLLAKPSAAITLIIAVGLTMGAVLSMAGPVFEKLTWVVSLLGFFLFVPALLHVSNLKHAPAFVHVALAFLLFALATTVVQWQSTAEVLAGIKRVFQAMGLFFALALLPLSEKELSRWRKLLIAIAFLQLPFALYEFFVLVPKRGGLQTGAAVTDVVAGTFGANLAGGSPNSVMAFLLFATLAFMFGRWKEGLLKARYLIIGLPVLLAPIALGEVKIAFVMLPIMLLVLFKQELIQRPVIFVGMMVVGALIISALGFIYLEYIINRPLRKVIEGTLAYNVYEKGYGTYFLNRTTVLTFWLAQQGWHDPLGFMFGHGLGSSFGAPGTLVFGHIAAKWPLHGIGLTTVSTLLWDVGLFGFILFMLVFVSAWHACNVLLRESQNPRVKADVSAIRALIPLFALFAFYNDTQVSLVSMEILYGLVLGYLAYLYRQQGKAHNSTVPSRERPFLLAGSTR